LRHDFLSPAVADARAEERLLAVLVMLKRVFDGLVQRRVAWKYPHHRNEKAGEGKIAPFSPASGNQNLKLIYNFSWNSHAEQEM
jgi:hypothetical protein